MAEISHPFFSEWPKSPIRSTTSTVAYIHVPYTFYCRKPVFPVAGPPTLEQPTVEDDVDVVSADLPQSAKDLFIRCHIHTDLHLLRVLVVLAAFLNMQLLRNLLIGFVSEYSNL